MNLVFHISEDGSEMVGTKNGIMNYNNAMSGSVTSGRHKL